MSDPAIFAAAKRLHRLDALSGESVDGPWSDEHPCESCITAVTPLVESARPYLVASGMAMAAGICAAHGVVPLMVDVIRDAAETMRSTGETL